METSKYGRGVALKTIMDTSVHDTKGHGAVTDVVSVAVFFDEEKELLTVFAVNRNLDEDILLEMDTCSFIGDQFREKIELACDNLKAMNDCSVERVKPGRSDKLLN